MQWLPLSASTGSVEIEKLTLRRQPSQFKCVHDCICCAYASLGVVKSTQKVSVEREIERECNMSL